MLGSSASVPSGLVHPAFVAVPLTPANVELDYAAYMASPAVIRVHSDGRWPVDGFTLEDDRSQAAAHHAEHQARRAFTFLLLDPAQCPAELPQCDNLLFRFLAQDIAHTEGAYKGSSRSQCPGLMVGRFSGDPLWPDLGDP